MKNNLTLSIIISDDGSNIGGRCNGKTIDNIIKQMEARVKHFEQNQQ